MPLAAGLLIVIAFATASPLLGGADCAEDVSGVCLDQDELDWYRANQVRLGEVVGRGRVDGRQYLFFTQYAARHAPGGWELLDLGLRDARRKGIPIRPNAVPHPVVQGHLDQQERVNAPWRTWLVVAPVTDAFCLATAPGSDLAACVQWFPYQAIRWVIRGGVADPTTLEFSPLGAEAPRQ